MCVSRMEMKYRSSEMNERKPFAFRAKREKRRPERRAGKEYCSVLYGSSLRVKRAAGKMQRLFFDSDQLPSETRSPVDSCESGLKVLESRILVSVNLHVGHMPFLRRRCLVHFNKSLTQGRSLSMFAEQDDSDDGRT